MKLLRYTLIIAGLISSAAPLPVDERTEAEITATIVTKGPEAIPIEIDPDICINPGHEFVSSKTHKIHRRGLKI
jgi:hypothetical protein